MGQEVKNPLRAQSKYGLMGSSAKTGKFFFEGHQSTFCIKMPFGIGHPHLHINCSLHVCRRVQGSQIFKRNSIILIRSKVMAFLVILLSPWSPHCPHHPHVIPIILVIPTSFPSSPHLPRVIPIAPRRSPCGPHGCDLCGLHSMLSPWVGVWMVGWMGGLICGSMETTWGQYEDNVPVVPTLSLSCPCHPHIIPNPQIPTPPTPTPWGVGALNH